MFKGESENDYGNYRTAVNELPLKTRAGVYLLSGLSLPYHLLRMLFAFGRSEGTYYVAYGRQNYWSVSIYPDLIS